MGLGEGAGGVAIVELHSFFTSALNGSEWSASRPGRSTSRKVIRYPINRRMGGPGASLNVLKKRKPACPEQDSNWGLSSLVAMTDYASLGRQNNA
jgi:hypothetical protein